MNKTTKGNVNSVSLFKKIGLIVLFLATFLFSAKAFASSWDTMPEIDTLAQEETVEGPGFFSGTLVRVDGTVNGTAFVTGENVQINGTINGDLFVAAQNATITGEITGNIYFAGMTIIMEGEVAQDTFMAGQTLTIGEDASLGRDLFTAGNRIIQAGAVERHMFGAGDSIVLNGSIGGDVNLDLNRLSLGNAAVINGDLTYTSDKEANMESGAQVQGETDFRQVERNRQDMYNRQMRRGFGSQIWFAVLSVLSAALIWLVIKLWRPTWWERTAQPLLERPLATMGIGLLALLVTPLLGILLMITIIGIPLAFILLTGYGIMLYLAKIFVSVAAALALTRRTRGTKRIKEGWLVILSLLILGLLGMVPILNFFLWVLMAIAGLGTFALSHYKKAAA